MRTCTKCGQERPLEDFRPRKSKSGYASWCRPCHRTASAQWQKRTGGEGEKPQRRKSNRNTFEERVRDRRLQRTYGISLDDLEQMLEEQEGRCLICGVELIIKATQEGRKTTRQTLVVDHCHDTGKVRGLLCQICNAAAGQLGEDPARIRRLADYLEGELL